MLHMDGFGPSAKGSGAFFTGVYLGLNSASFDGVFANVIHGGCFTSGPKARLASFDGVLLVLHTLGVGLGMGWFSRESRWG